jgi:hypothetical protein
MVKIGVPAAMVVGLVLPLAFATEPAYADYAPTRTDVVAIGADTLQYMMDFLADGDAYGDTGYKSAMFKQFLSIERPSRACRRHLPGERSCRVDGDIDDGGFDRVDLPAFGEGGSNFTLSYPARSPISWLSVAEAKHVVAATDWDDFSQAVDEQLPLVIAEDMKEPAVEHGVERLAQLDEPEGIEDEEPRLQTTLGRLVLGQLDRHRRDVDPDRLVPEGSGEQDMLTCPTTDIKHLAHQLPRVRKPLERWLWPPDVPRWCATGVAGVEVVGRARWTMGRRCGSVGHEDVLSRQATP